MELIKSKTYKNLAASYAGECQAQVRYKFIEYGARNEGYEALAELVATVAYNEFNHARMFYTYIQKASKNTIENVEISSGYPFKEKWNLVENLAFAAEDEKNEFKKIYPAFAKTARAEGFEDIAKLYENIIQVESCHFKLFSDLHKQLSDGSLYKKPKKTKWKCLACGYETTDEQAPKTCPLCASPQGKFMLKVKSE
ncbi:MAG: ferritin family protein [Candidatus Borkfalkiaceae bacterium]|nr:ferritin family protein [Christensenellaceae bacterium]